MHRYFSKAIHTVHPSCLSYRGVLSAGRLGSHLYGGACQHALLFCRPKSYASFHFTRSKHTSTRTPDAKPDASSSPSSSTPLPPDAFELRHIGPSPEEQRTMLKTLGFEAATLEGAWDAFMKTMFPKDIPLMVSPNHARAPLSEAAMLVQLREVARQNQVKLQFLGQGFYGTHIPAVLQRNLLENPGWYTSYSPYQPEISQGRLTSLFTFQTLVAELTGMPLANASLLDEGSAAAEAMMLCTRLHTGKRDLFFVDHNVFLHTKASLQMRAEGIGVQLVQGDVQTMSLEGSLKDRLIGVLVQYPAAQGNLWTDLTWLEALKEAKVPICCATDLLALTLLKPPGELGMDIAFGNAQRLGVPMGWGGPHAAFFACRAELKRKLPGRIVGLSRDRAGTPAFRLALQTREQHIRREKATSNICTAQALLANLSAMYAVHHGPEGLLHIARRIHGLAAAFARQTKALGFALEHDTFFDTVTVRLASNDEMQRLLSLGEQKGLIPGYTAGHARISVAFDETHTTDDLYTLLGVFAQLQNRDFEAPPHGSPMNLGAHFKESEHIPKSLVRTSTFLQQDVFHAYRSETELLRYLKQLENMDLSLCHAMIPLGSCTMKLNPTAALQPLSWPEFANLHPYVPLRHSQGYTALLEGLEGWLCELTGMANVSFQPNSGAQGEYTGLRVLQAYLDSQGQGHRRICLIPTSAHGTNPASAVLAGLQVVPVPCKKDGRFEMEAVHALIQKHAAELACIMLTYPSTFGRMDPGLPQLAEWVHAAGGQVYLDGGNFNALVGWVQPAALGVDVCHLNLHKTFCIPHGGGGPGAGPIAVRPHLVPFLPTHPQLSAASPHALGPVNAAPHGSALLYPVPYGYLGMMGTRGVRRATQTALLSANFLLHNLRAHYTVIPAGSGACAHEFLLDLQPFHALDVRAIDVAKRLLDYSLHAPTLAWPVSHALMIEPTESESVRELERLLAALVAIREEISQIERGTWPRTDNPLCNAPHTLQACLSEPWTHPYSREVAAFPLPGLKTRKCWPTTGRVDDVYGDTHLVCTWPRETESGP